MNASTDSRLKTLIERHEYKEIANAQLFELAGFNEKECKMASTFWDSAYNRSKFLLTDEMILEELTTETGSTAIANFNRQVLKVHYKEGEDYDEVDKNNALVKQYLSLLELTRKKDTRGGSNKRYFLITGECYKMMLQTAATKKGREAKSYYIKLESLVVLLRDYSAARLQHQLERATAEKQQAEEERQKSDARAAKAEKKVEEIGAKVSARLLTVKNFIQGIQAKPKNEYFYVGGSPNDFRDHKSFMGKTDAPPHRLDNYNCKKTGDAISAFYFCEPCNDAHDVENTIRRHFGQFLVPGTKDVFFIRIDYMLKIAATAVGNQDKIIDNFNQLVGDISKDINDENIMSGNSNYFDTIEPPTPVDMSKFEEEKPKSRQSITPDSAEQEQEEESEPKKINEMDDEERTPLIRAKLKTFIDAQYTINFDFDAPLASNKKPLKVEWMLFKNAFLTEIGEPKARVTTIKNNLKVIVDGVTSLRIKWR